MKLRFIPFCLLASSFQMGVLLGDVRVEKPGPEANDKPTAYAALRRVQAELGGDSLNRIVEVSGREGVPQPYLWKITLSEPSGTLRELDIADGKVAARRAIPRGSVPAAGAAINTRELNLDSSGAFATADAQARKIHLSFDTLNYTLRTDTATNKPVWTIQLLNTSGEEMGTLVVAANDGTIITETGRLAGANQAVALPPPEHSEVTTTTEEDERAAGGFMERSGRTLDHTGKKVERTLRHAGATVERFFTGKSDLDKE